MPSRRLLALAGLAAFAIVDVVLIGMAFGVFGGDRGAEGEGTPRLPTAAVSEDLPASEDPAEESEGPPPASRVLRNLAVVDATTAWRAERGSCDAQAVIEVTTDAGVSWTATQPVTTGGREVFWLWAQDRSYAQAAVTAGNDCAPTGIRTFTGGEFWQENGQVLSDASYIAGDGALVTATGFGAPCGDAIDLAERGDALAVLCADGTLHETADGQAWARTSVPGAVALTSAGDGYAIAVQGFDSCEGIALVAIAPDGIAASLPANATGNCLTGLVDPASTVVEASGEALWLWSGGEMSVSEIPIMIP